MFQGLLKKKIFEAGKEAVEDFVGMQLSPDTDQAAAEDLFNQAYMQMPDDILESFEKKYLVPLKATIVKRALCLQHVEGYVLQFEDGTELSVEMWTLVDRVNDNFFQLENAKVCKNSYGWYGLRGKGCSLSKLPGVTIEPEDLDKYREAGYIELTNIP